MSGVYIIIILITESLEHNSLCLFQCRLRWDSKSSFIYISAMHRRSIFTWKHNVGRRLSACKKTRKEIIFSVKPRFGWNCDYQISGFINNQIISISTWNHDFRVLSVRLFEQLRLFWVHLARNQIIHLLLDRSINFWHPIWKSNQLIISILILIWTVS